MREFCYSAIALLAWVTPAYAAVSISSPVNGSDVTSPFALSAAGLSCAGQSVAAMGYSLDNSSNTVIVSGASVVASVAAPLGPHVLHLDYWSTSGDACVANISLTVIPSSTPVNTSKAPVIPSDAIAVNNIQALSNWEDAYDTGSGSGSSTGQMQIVATPSRSGSAREFVTDFTNAGGERYWIVFDDDTAATNFLYDTWVYLANPSSGIANLEMDMNQVMANGQTVIYGFQCDGYTRTWDYTENAGTPAAYRDVWVHSNQPCNLQNWKTKTWHHVQISYSRDAAGHVTYQSVWLDGVQQVINATVPSAFALGWSSVLLTNFQVDGLGASGTSTVYLDDLSVYRW